MTEGAKSMVSEVAAIPITGVRAVATAANNFGNVACRVVKLPGKGLGIVANTTEAVLGEITGNGK